MSHSKTDEYGRRYTTIRLSGELGRRFGKVHKFWIKDPAEAVRALCSQVKGFADYMRAPDRTTRYRVFVADQQIDPEQEFHIPHGHKEVRIAPVIQGAKDGWVTAVLGVALIGLAFAFPGAALGSFQIGGTGGMLFSVGVGLTLSGIAAAISPQPSLDTSSGGTTNNNTSLGQVNNTIQGGQGVPLAYGRVVASPLLISAGLTPVDVTPAGGTS